METARLPADLAIHHSPAGGKPSPAFMCPRPKLAILASCPILRQLWPVVPDVADLLVDLPGAQHVVRGSTQQPCCIAIHLAQPDRPVGPLDDDGHPVLEPCSSTFASVVIVAKVCKSSPSGDFHISHTPPKATGSPSTRTTRTLTGLLASGQGGPLAPCRRGQSRDTVLCCTAVPEATATPTS